LSVNGRIGVIHMINKNIEYNNLLARSTL